MHGKAAIVAIKPSPIIAINEPVFPRVLMLCLVNDGILKLNQRLYQKKSLMDTIPTIKRKTPIKVFVNCRLEAPIILTNCTTASAERKNTKNTVAIYATPMARALTRDPVRASVPIKKISTEKTHGFSPLITPVVKKRASGKLPWALVTSPVAVEFPVALPVVDCGVGVGVGTTLPII